MLVASLFLFPVTLNYLSPYVVIQGSFSGVVTGSLMLFASLLISSLLLGRAFCGWVCPGGAVQDCVAAVNTRATGQRLNRIKYFLWAPWLAVIIFGFVSAGGIQRLDALYMTEGGVSVSESSRYIIYFFVIGLLLLLALALGRRAACHGICWMAPFMVLGRRAGRAMKLPSLRLRFDESACIDCKLCDKNCPMSLTVQEDLRRGAPMDECILCGQCADACPKDAIRMGFYRA